MTGGQLSPCSPLSTPWVLLWLQRVIQLIVQLHVRLKKLVLLCRMWCDPVVTTLLIYFVQINKINIVNIYIRDMIQICVDDFFMELMEFEQWMGVWLDIECKLRYHISVSHNLVQWVAPLYDLEDTCTVTKSYFLTLNISAFLIEIKGPKCVTKFWQLTIIQ